MKLCIFWWKIFSNCLQTLKFVRPRAKIERFINLSNILHMPINFISFSEKKLKNPKSDNFPLRKLAKIGLFAKKKCVISKINFQKICVPVCAHHFPPKILDKNFENFEYLKLCIFWWKIFWNCLQTLKIRETARQKWEIYQFVEHSAYAHKFYIIFEKSWKIQNQPIFP